MLILGFPEACEAARLLAEALNWDYAAVDIHHFPDGESRLSLPEELPATVAIFRGLHEPNDKLVELYLAIAAARRRGCQRLILVAPYLCYMRQDKAFNPGEVVSQPLIGELISHWVDDLITVDPHLHRIALLSAALPYCRALSLTAAPLLGTFLKVQGVRGILVGPDEESRQWVTQVAVESGLPFVIASKKRYSDTEVVVSLPPAEDFRGQRAILVDDVISSGHTLIEAAQQLFARGADSVGALCTHGLFAPGAQAAMIKAGIAPIWTSNGIPHPSNCIDLTPIISEAISSLMAAPNPRG